MYNIISMKYYVMDYLFEYFTHIARAPFRP